MMRMAMCSIMIMTSTVVQVAAMVLGRSRGVATAMATTLGVIMIVVPVRVVALPTKLMSMTVRERRLVATLA